MQIRHIGKSVDPFEMALRIAPSSPFHDANAHTRADKYVKRRKTDTLQRISYVAAALFVQTLWPRLLPCPRKTGALRRFL